MGRTGRQTATGDSIEAAKAHSAVQAWAIALKDVLEQAFVFTSEWVGEPKNPEVVVYTDFSVTLNSQAPLAAIATARATGDISRQTLWINLQRYDILPADFDGVAEEKLLKAEEDEAAKKAALISPVPKRDPVTGLAIPSPLPAPPPA